MFKFKIDPTLNDAFEYDRGAEVARILREIAAKVEAGQESGVAHDYNGASVGSWEFNDHEDAKTERDGEMFDRLLSSWPDLKSQAETLMNDEGFVFDDEALDTWQAGDVLSVDVDHIHTVMLALNGPTEYVEIKCTPDDEAVSMTWVNTYGDVTASRNVQSNTSLWHLMARAAGVEA